MHSQKVDILQKMLSKEQQDLQASSSCLFSHMTYWEGGGTEVSLWFYPVNSYMFFIYFQLLSVSNSLLWIEGLAVVISASCGCELDW